MVAVLLAAAAVAGLGAPQGQPITLSQTALDTKLSSLEGRVSDLDARVRSRSGAVTSGTGAAAPVAPVAAVPLAPAVAASPTPASAVLTAASTGVAAPNPPFTYHHAPAHTFDYPTGANELQCTYPTKVAPVNQMQRVVDTVLGVPGLFVVWYEQYKAMVYDEPKTFDNSAEKLCNDATLEYCISLNKPVATRARQDFSNGR